MNIPFDALDKSTLRDASITKIKGITSPAITSMMPLTPKIATTMLQRMQTIIERNSNFFGNVAPNGTIK